MTPVYAVGSFSFLIKGMGRMTGNEFADKVCESYSTDNPETKEAVGIIRKVVDWIESYHHGLTIVRFHQNEYDKIARL